MYIKRTGIFAPNSKPFGLTLGEWSIKWWQWLLKIQKPTSPALDDTGRNAHVGQSNPNVFFLCQTIEGGRQRPNRIVYVNRGACVFMPIINWVSNLEYGNSENELIKIARQKMDAIGDLELNINGTIVPQLQKYRFLSDFFTVELPNDNILDLPAGKTQLISDGYWIFTEPIITDTMISTFGSCSFGVTKIGVSYSIKIA